jgi:TRAP-type C4-dicarboxylate transport system substrate-binding protein
MMGKRSGKSYWLALAAALSCTAAVAKPARAPIHLTIASSHSTNLVFVGAMHSLVVPQTDRRLEAMGSPFRVRWTEAYGGSLYKYQNTLEAIEIGLTDIGWVGTLWESSKMPLQNVTYYAPFVTDDLPMLLEIFNDLHESMPALRDSWRAQNQVYLGASGVETYHLMTTFPVRTMADLRGRKILAPGSSATWLEGTGAVPVDGGLTTYYTQIKTGVAEGVLTILSGAYPYRIHEVAPYVTLVGIGAMFNGAMTINLDTWRRLPKDVQGVLAQLGREYSREIAEETSVRYQHALTAMQAEGAHVSELPKEEKLKWLENLPDIAGRWAAATEKRGYPAREVLHAFLAAVRARGGTPLRDWDAPNGG